LKLSPSAGEPSDAELLARSRSGEPRAFAELVSRHGRYLYGIARSLLRDAHDAEDAVQETLAAASTAAFSGQSQVRTWMVAILVRQAGLVRRKRAGWLRRLTARPPEAASGSEESGVDARLDLADVLEKLDPDLRDVIVLRELEQMSYQQIADVLGVPRGTVESRLHRARATLRGLLKPVE
jgi:RNA polymerase sigma-70 factor (ECF subfamily)